MTEFRVPVTYTFEGVFYIKAESAEQAETYARRHCGMVLDRDGGDIHSTLPYNDVEWDFPVHPKEVVHEAEECR